MTNEEFATEQADNLDAALDMLALVASKCMTRPGFESFTVMMVHHGEQLEELKMNMEHAAWVHGLLKEKGIE